MELDLAYSFIVSILGSIIIATVLSIQLWNNKREIRLRQRPWLSFHRPYNEKASLEFFENKIIIHMVNQGPVPAYDVEYFIYSESFQPEEENIDYKHSEQIPMDIAPSEVWKVTLNFKPEIKIDPENKIGVVYYGIKFTYKDLDRCSHYYEYRGHYDNGYSPDDYSKMDRTK